MKHIKTLNAAEVCTEQYAGEQAHFIIAVGAFALLAKLLHPFPCLRVYDRLVVVLENHLLFRGIFYTVLDFVRKFFCLEIYQTACVFPVFKDMHYGIGRPLALIAGVAVADEVLEKAVEKVFDLRPTQIIKTLDLRRPIYRNLAAYGHMGREDLGVNWEKTDKVEALLAAVK